MSKGLKKFKEKMDISYEDFFKYRFDAIVSTARKFEPIVGREKMLVLLEELSTEKSVEEVKQRIKDKEINSFDDFKKFLLELFDTEYVQKTAVWEITENSPTRLKFHYKECLWAKTMKELNAAEIGCKMFCNPDFAIAKAYHPKIKLTRTKTLMKGDDCCDHTYTWEE